VSHRGSHRHRPPPSPASLLQAGAAAGPAPGRRADTLRYVAEARLASSLESLVWLQLLPSLLNSLLSAPLGYAGGKHRRKRLSVAAAAVQAPLTDGSASPRQASPIRAVFLS